MKHETAAEGYRLSCEIDYAKNLIDRVKNQEQLGPLVRILCEADPDRYRSMFVPLQTSIIERLEKKIKELETQLERL